MGLGCDIDVAAPPLRRRNVRYGSFSEVSAQVREVRYPTSRGTFGRPMGRGCLVLEGLGKGLKNRMVKMQTTLVACPRNHLYLRPRRPRSSISSRVEGLHSPYQLKPNTLKTSF